MWKLPSLVAVLTLRGHKRGVWHAAFSPVDQVQLRHQFQDFVHACCTCLLHALVSCLGPCLIVLLHARALYREMPVVSG